MNFGYLSHEDSLGFLELEKVIIAEANRLEEAQKTAETIESATTTVTPPSSSSANYNIETNDEFDFLDREVERIQEEIRREEAEKAAAAALQGTSNFQFHTDSEEMDFLVDEIEKIREDIRREEAEKAAAAAMEASHRVASPFWQGDVMTDSESDALWRDLLRARGEAVSPQQDPVPSSTESDCDVMWREIQRAQERLNSPQLAPDYTSPQGSPIAPGMTDSQEKALWGDLIKIYDESG